MGAKLSWSQGSGTALGLQMIFGLIGCFEPRDFSLVEHSNTNAFGLVSHIQGKDFELFERM